MLERGSRLWMLMAATGLGVALIGVIGAQAAGPKLSGGSQVEEESVRLTEDGNWVVYIEYDSPSGTLYSTSIDGAITNRLADAPIAGGSLFIQPKVSPDSQWAVFVADREVDDVQEIFSVPIDGSSPPVKLNSTPATGGDVKVDFYITADSSRVVYTADQDTDEVFELYSVPIDGSSAPTKLNGALTADGDVWLGFPSPDGQTVVYRADQNTDELFELFAVPTDGSSSAVKISGTPSGGGDVRTTWLVSPDGTHVVYLGDQDTIDVMEIYSTPINGSSPPVKLSGTMATGGDAWASIEITPDSSRVIYWADQDTDEVFELYSAPIDGSSSAVRLNGSLVTGGNVDSVFRISGDSTRVVYLADQDTDDVFELYSVAVSGGTPVRVHDPLPTTADVLPFGLRIVDGSNQVIFIADQDTDDVFELYASDITGGSASKLSGPMPTGGDVNRILDVGDVSNRVLYRADQVTDDVFELFTVPVSGGAPVTASDPIGPANGDVNYGFFVPGNDAVVWWHGDTETDGIYELFASSDGGYEFAVDHTGDTADLDGNDGLCLTSLGNCTLRAALEQANASGGPNRVTFAIPGSGTHTITPNDVLPTSLEPVIIDATTQPSYVDAPLIAVDGSLAGSSRNGFRMTGDSTIRGLAITGFGQNGVVFTGGGNRVEKCFIGLDPDGTANPNGAAGVNVTDPVSDVVGGVAEAGNVISGNGSHGVSFSGSGYGWVSGNLIGTDPSGTAPRANGGHGVAVNSAGTLEVHVGTKSPGLADGNVLAFNALDGVSISGAGANVWFWENSVHDNGGLGIDYEPPNGVGGGTYPIPAITDVSVGSGFTQISGTLPSAYSTFSIAAYSSPVCDVSGSGEGEVYLGLAGFAGSPVDTFTISVPGEVATRDVVTVTFIAENSSTSEFSECFLFNNPPVAADASWSVAEDAAIGTVVGTVSGSDDPGEALSYAITGGNAGGAFAIDGASGEVTVASGLDFESVAAYTVTVEVSDGLESDTATVTVTVIDVPEFVVPDEPTFDDVEKTNVFFSQIEWLAWTGITKGCNPAEGNTKFCPTNNVTRGQMAAFLHRALDGIITPGAPVTFDDIGTSIFKDDIEWLAATGVTKGCNPAEGNTRFCPNDNVTRGQMAAFLERALD